MSVGEWIAAACAAGALVGWFMSLRERIVRLEDARKNHWHEISRLRNMLDEGKFLINPHRSPAREADDE